MDNKEVNTNNREASTNNDDISEYKSNKNNDNNKKRKNSKVKSIIIAVILIIIFVIVLIVFLLSFDNDVIISVGQSGVGNTIGNIKNYGYLATDDTYLYYMSPNDEGSAMSIQKIDKNDLTGEPETIIEGVWEIFGINYSNGYLYFITMADADDEDEEDTVDNKIHRIKTDGTEHEVINDNEFNNSCYEIYVVNNKLYYIGTDECIYYMDLDGNNKTMLNNYATGYIGITEDYIFFNKIIETDDAEAEEDETTEIDYVTYMMDIDGSNEHAIIEGEKMYNINVVGNYIYYLNSEQYIFRVKLDGTENTMISDETAYNLNVAEDGIFYFNYYQIDGETAGVAIYSMDLDGENLTEILRLEQYSEMLCEFDNWLFFADNNESEGRFELVSKDGKQSIVLYRLDFSQYTTTDDDEEEEESTEDDTSEEEDDDELRREVIEIVEENETTEITTETEETE